MYVRTHTTGKTCARSYMVYGTVTLRGAYSPISVKQCTSFAHRKKDRNEQPTITTTCSTLANTWTCKNSTNKKPTGVISSTAEVFIDIRLFAYYFFHISRSFPVYHHYHRIHPDPLTFLQHHHCYYCRFVVVIRYSIWFSHIVEIGRTKLRVQPPSHCKLICRDLKFLFLFNIHFYISGKLYLILT